MVKTKNFLITHCTEPLLTNILSGIDISSIGGIFRVESIISDDKPLFDVMKVAYAIEQSGVHLQYRGGISSYAEIIQEFDAPELKIIDRFWTITSMNGNEPVFDIGSLDVPAPLKRFVATPREDGYWQIERFNSSTSEYEPLKGKYPSQESAEAIAARLNEDETSD